MLTVVDMFKLPSKHRLLAHSWHDSSEMLITDRLKFRVVHTGKMQLWSLGECHTQVPSANQINTGLRQCQRQDRTQQLMEAWSILHAHTICHHNFIQSHGHRP